MTGQDGASRLGEMWLYKNRHISLMKGCSADMTNLLEFFRQINYINTLNLIHSGFLNY